MNSDNIGYVVAVRNQASGNFEDVTSTVLHGDREGAEWERDLHVDETRRTGRREEYVICAVVPVEADGA